MLQLQQTGADLQIFGFGVKGKSLVLSRVEKSVKIQNFTVNNDAIQASKMYEIADAKFKQVEDLKNQQKQKEDQEKKAKETGMFVGAVKTIEIYPDKQICVGASLPHRTNSKEKCI